MVCILSCCHLDIFELPALCKFLSLIDNTSEHCLSAWSLRLFTCIRILIVVQVPFAKFLWHFRKLPHLSELEASVLLILFCFVILVFVTVSFHVFYWVTLVLLDKFLENWINKIKKLAERLVSSKFVLWKNALGTRLHCNFQRQMQDPGNI